MQYYKYHISFINYHSWYCWIFPMINKSKATTKFINIKQLVEKQFQHPIKILYSNGGGKHSNKILQAYLTTHSIIHQFSCTSVPKENGLTECKHHHLLETTWALMLQANLPQILWTDALLTATYLINLLRTPTTNNKTHLQLLYHRQPNYSHIKTFECLFFLWLRLFFSNKFSATPASSLATSYIAIFAFTNHSL